MSVSNEELFRIVAEWVRSTYPGRLPRRLRISLDGEDEVTLPIPLLPPVPAAGTTDTFETRVLAALEDESPLTAKKLAPRTGYSYCSSFRQKLADLVRAGVLEQTPDGYRTAE